MEGAERGGPHGLTVGYLAERNARQHPEREAIVDRTGDRREAVTFEAFDERVDRVANALRELGVERGDAVASYTRNGVETLECYVAPMKIGALPVPVNHRFASEEVAHVLADSGATVCVFDRPAAETVERVRRESAVSDVEFIFAGTDGPGFARSYEGMRERADPSPVDVVPTRLDDAALMYTSGTTGRPKGCILTHDNVLQRVENGLMETGIDRGGRSLVVTPLFHIAGFGRFLNDFYVGNATVLLDDFDPEGVLSVLEEERITSAFFVPTMARRLLSVLEEREYDLSAFETFGIGAAPAGEELKREIIDAFDCELREAFGQTELSPTTTMLVGDEALEKPDSVGRPTVNVEVKVVDEDGRAVEPGEIGRIAYRGPTVFRGYHGMPERTAAAFDDGWFVSSDLVTMDEDGYVYFVGRADDTIVTGGENVHPAEIEEVLDEHPAIEEAAVIGVPDEEWGERIKAAVVRREGASLTAKDVEEYVGERLAGYKKPREVEFLDELPRSRTGKIDRGELS